MATGTVLSLHRWPVKSFAGEPARALRLDRRGVAGDRAHAVYGEWRGRPRRLTARSTPRLLAWEAAYPEAPDDALDPGAVPRPRVTAPDGAVYEWGDPALAEALAHDLGRPVKLRRSVRLMQDRTDTVHVTVEATRRALAAQLGHPMDLRRFRTNLHVELDAEPFAEEGWRGRRLRVGDAELELRSACVRCDMPNRDPDTLVKDTSLMRWLAREHRALFGLIGRAAEPAVVRVGDRVELL